MALVVYDRVQETTATTGTGTITLAGAVSGYQSFAVVGNGNTTFYCITSGSAWEVGIGTYTSSGTTLARTTVLSNSSGNTSPISLTGTSTVFCTYPSEKSINQNAAGYISYDFSNSTLTSRLNFQTSTTNSSTGIYALPNGTSVAASWQAANNSDPTNASKVLIATNGTTDVQLVSGINGTGTYLPLTFYNNGGEKMRLSVAGGLYVGTAGTDAGATNIQAAGNVTGAQVIASNGLYVNSKTVSVSYSIPSGSSAMSAGPMTVASGVTVTVPSGSRWVVL